MHGSRGTLYLHVSLADLATTTGGGRHPQNLACLCRRHHRAKTFAGWRYRRLPDDDAGRATYEWTSPHLRTYRVTPHHLVG